MAWWKKNVEAWHRGKKHGYTFVRNQILNLEILIWLLLFQFIKKFGIFIYFSPRNTELLLRKLCLFQTSSFSNLFYDRFNELLSMNIAAFHEYLDSWFFQTIQMKATKYLKLKNDKDPWLVTHSSCLIDEVFVETYCKNDQKRILEIEKRRKEEDLKRAEEKKKRQEEKKKALEDKKAKEQEDKKNKELNGDKKVEEIKEEIKEETKEGAKEEQQVDKTKAPLLHQKSLIPNGKKHLSSY